MAKKREEIKSQKEIFEASEANEWFSRNKASYEANVNCPNEIVDLLRQIELSPGKVLEIGCSNGFRLDQVREEFDCECFGIDPSAAAIEHGKKMYPAISLSMGTADELVFENDSFDTIIFGFCLCMCDRKDLFKIAYEADRCLKNGGSMVVGDFLPPFPYKNGYSHLDGIYTYKMNYGRMFDWNPAYTEVAKVVYSHSGFKLRDIPDERLGAIVLRKNEQAAYPMEPFKRDDS